MTNERRRDPATLPSRAPTRFPRAKARRPAAMAMLLVDCPVCHDEPVLVTDAHCNRCGGVPREVRHG